MKIGKKPTAESSSNGYFGSSRSEVVTLWEIANSFFKSSGFVFDFSEVQTIKAVSF